MTAILAREVQAIQNPGLGAVLLWRFAVGYASSRGAPETTPMPVLFLPLPILFHEETVELVRRTRTGLRGFADKFLDSTFSETDVLLSLERRAKALRPLSLMSIRIAIDSRILLVDARTADVMALSSTKPRGVPESVRPLLKSSEKLGEWCGAVSLFELSSVLRVGF